MQSKSFVIPSNARRGCLEGRTAALAALTLGVICCATPAVRRAATSARPACAYAACGADAISLAKVTAADLQTTPDRVFVGAIEPQFNGAVLVWKARTDSRIYICREGRDPGDAGAVHYVDCRRLRPGAPQPTPLKAFP